MQHITKSAEPVTMGKALPEVMRRAFWQLRNGRGGPVLVEVPLDVFREDVGDFTYVPSFKARSGPDPEAVHDIAKILASAKNPVIYAGQGVHYAKAWDELKSRKEVGVSIDVFQMGILFFKKDQIKENFRIRY